MLHPVSMKLLLLIRKIVLTAVGVVFIVAGIAMILLPGPAIVFIPLGVAILSIEYDWAKRLLQWLKEKIGKKKSSQF